MISQRPVMNTNEIVLYSTHTAIAPNTTVITPSSGLRNRLRRIHVDVPERTRGPSSGGGAKSGSEPTSTMASLIARPSSFDQRHACGWRR